MNGRATNARDVAVSALRDRAGNVSAHLDRLLDSSIMAAEERALARELTLGVVRRRQTILTILRAFLDRPDRKLPTPLEEVLSVGVYQLVFLERVPTFAAVNEAVKQATNLRHKRQAGLVNGVLRAIARSISPLQQGRAPLAADIVPVSAKAYRKLDRAVFPDPQLAPEQYIAEAYSLPVELAGRWLQSAGSLSVAVGWAEHANTRAPLILRVNRMRASVSQVIESLATEGIKALPHENGQSVVLARSLNITKLKVFADGWVQAQDPTATAVVLAARSVAGMAVLDFCAAPGTKTTHLAERMDNTGSITAVDVSQEKIARIESNCQRLGISIVSTLLAEQVGGLSPGSFDLALVDVPCSNTGVLARRPEARWRFGSESLAVLTRDQRLLASAAAQFVRRGGRLIYSTCSIEPEECGQLIRRVPGLKLVDEQLVLPAGADDPTRWHDGGYYAVAEVR